ncbi:MAG TPA: hypothetical protein VIM44_07845 [Rariglobus sp.]
MSNPTFAEIYCLKHNLPPEAFARSIFNRALYRRTLLVKWLLPLLHHGYFSADFDLIYGVERLRRMRDFATEAERFNEHPANRGFLRRTLGLRVSTTRLRALIRETLPRSAGITNPPLLIKESSAAPFEMTMAGGH